ncbi:hypothetical protein [Sphingomonas sp. BK235]|uniref:hypothetical protein n=1 Tax=Sphingomonas sp. BK235 TaxID=2512131 RepID=UPI00104D7551|nr:hypothetical protein [Sphingomonas sp. BK235]TCP36564.1 hypothetical protein EV292_10160 [Sphingomonas sp. BK235]
MFNGSVTVFRITVADNEDVSEGLERHASYSAARYSAVRSAVNIMLSKPTKLFTRVATCEVRNETTGAATMFDVNLTVGSDRTH